MVRLLLIKAELGRSRLVVASRFHALVSALTQGVPAIATSWSHKYEMLFADYGCPDLVLPVPAEAEPIHAAVTRTLGPERDGLVEALQARAKAFMVQTREMWQEVDGILQAHTRTQREVNPAWSHLRSYIAFAKRPVKRRRDTT